MVSIKGKAANGVIWSFAQQFLSKGVLALTTIVLAWFLVPEEYALVAMLAVFVSLSSALVDGGLTQALIRKVDIKEIDLDTVFITNIALSFFIYLVIYMVAPYISLFYEEYRLTNLIRVVSISVFFQAFYLVPQVILARNLDFKRQAGIVFPATFCSSFLALFLAYKDFGVWALILQIVFYNSLMAVFYFVSISWRPKFNFSVDSLKQVWGFSSYIVTDSLFAIPFRNMYLIVLPKYFSAGPVGLYFFAEKIKEILLQLTVYSVVKVIFPALSKFQNRPEKLKQGFREVIICTTFLVFPVMTFLLALAPVLFEALLPVNWFGAAIYLQLMCLASFMTPLNAINLNILKVRGRSDLVLYLGLFKKMVTICILFYTLQFDVKVIIIGQVIASIVNYVPNSFYAYRLVNYKVSEQLADFLPALLLSFAIGAIIYYLEAYLNFSPFIKVMILGSLAFLSYVVVSYLLKLKAFNLSKQLFRSRFKNK